jgi:hypothetical protein
MADAARLTQAAVGLAAINLLIVILILWGSGFEEPSLPWGMYTGKITSCTGSVCVTGGEYTIKYGFTGGTTEKEAGVIPALSGGGAYNCGATTEDVKKDCDSCKSMGMLTLILFALCMLCVGFGLFASAQRQKGKPTPGDDKGLLMSQAGAVGIALVGFVLFTMSCKPYDAMSTTAGVTKGLDHSYSTGFYLAILFVLFEGGMVGLLMQLQKLSGNSANMAAVAPAP